MAMTANNLANELTPGYQAETPFPSAGSPASATVAPPASPATPTLAPTNNVDPAVEIPSMLMAQDSFLANLAVIAQAQSLYQSILRLGAG